MNRTHGGTFDDKKNTQFNTKFLLRIEINKSANIGFALHKLVLDQISLKNLLEIYVLISIATNECTKVDGLILAMRFLLNARSLEVLCYQFCYILNGLASG